MFLLLSVINLTGIFCQNDPIVYEAEQASLGSDFEIVSDGEIEYIKPKTDFLNSAFPGSDIKVASFSVSFPEAGIYKLYARIFVGENGANDDSFFYGNGFGTKNPTSEFDWIMCNNMNVAGYTILTDVVEEIGDASTGLWKWVALSDYTGGEAPLTFSVEIDGLDQILQLGARENGFAIDKIAFGKNGIFYTVDNLNNGEAGSKTHPGRPYNGPPLATGLDKFLGCVHSRSSKRDVTEYFNQLTPGNAGKWGWVESRRDTMVWTELDEAYQAAMDNGYIYKHHVMVWGAQQPSWIAELDSAEQRAELEEWFAAVAERYPGAHQVEVVNEPLHNAPDASNEGNYINALGGAGDSGWDWILESFRMAREAFSDTTVLMINEYSIMNSNSNTDQYLDIIHLLQEEDLIDAIGFQAHGFSHNVSNEIYLRNLDTLASTGLPLYATELDIDGPTDLEHVHNYMNLFPLLWEHPAIKGITLWGFKPAMWRGDEGCYLIDEEGEERPAMKWLRAYLNNAFIANESITVSSVNGFTTIDTLGGILQLEAQVFPDTSTISSVYWSVNNPSIATINEEGLITALSNGTVIAKAQSLELDSEVSDQVEITITNQETLVNTVSWNEKVKIYPNPVKEGQFTISGISQECTIAICDLQGKIVFLQSASNSDSHVFNLEISPGLYLFTVTKGEKILRDKIVVE
ncbi:MAG: endo-1,4-beta-xylanase [Bacteroidales bacterium]|nr:endo-1,4-beta-xylanase [Bacteroidales bacterium]MBN2820384.1 endo-1,4-beta-xylanase [Bacteroidales bacterium]